MSIGWVVADLRARVDPCCPEYIQRMWDALQDPVIAAALVREAPDIIATLDRDGRILQANPAAVRQSG
jgi:PAS domain-containing protein